MRTTRTGPARRPRNQAPPVRRGGDGEIGLTGRTLLFGFRQNPTVSIACLLLVAILTPVSAVAIGLWFLVLWPVSVAVFLLVCIPLVAAEVRIPPPFGPAPEVVWLRSSRPIRSVPVEHLAGVLLRAYRDSDRDEGSRDTVVVVITERDGRRTYLHLARTDAEALRSSLAELLEPAGVAVRQRTKWVHQVET